MRHKSLAACLTMGLLALLVLRAFGRPAARNGPATAAATPQIRMDTIVVESRAVPHTEAVSGHVEPVRLSTVAAQVAERVIDRRVKPGDEVRRGDVLLRLDATLARDAVAQAEAAARQARAGRMQAQAEYQRASIETLAAVQQARAQLNGAQANAHKAASYTRRQELHQAEASLDQANTEARLDEIELKRYEQLGRQGLVSAETVDRVRATYETAVARQRAATESLSLAREGARREDRQSAVAQVDAARAGVTSAQGRDARLAALSAQIDGLRAQEAAASAQLEQARTTLSRHTIRAPYDGVVLDTLVEVGDTVGAGTPVVRFADTSTMKIVFAVPEAARPHLRLHGRVRFTVDALAGQDFEGEIHTLGWQADAHTRAFPVEVWLKRESGLLPNMVARLRVDEGMTEASPWVPMSAVATDGAHPYVYVVNDNRALRRAVETGETHGEDVQIRAGLRSGERIAATPQRLSDGAEVRP
jgi:RND family efflux transporter MFP subunit